jgi:hypothetical protein
MKYPIVIAYCVGSSLLATVAQAQLAVSVWPTTHLDSLASVEMPYEGTIDEKGAADGLLIYGTGTSDNQFDAWVYTPKPTQPTKAGTALTVNVDKFLALVMREPNPAFEKPKLKSSFPVTVPTAPGGRAMHQVYSGFDQVHQSPATLELTWIAVGPTLYVFRCSYQTPADQGSTDDMQHFFKTITFRSAKP